MNEECILLLLLMPTTDEGGSLHSENHPLAPLMKYSNATLKTYIGEQITVLESIDFKVTYQSQKKQLPIVSTFQIRFITARSRLATKDWLGIRALDTKDLMETSRTSKSKV